MRPTCVPFLAAATLLATLPLAAQTLAPGSGAANEAIRTHFVNAFYRGSFSSLAELPPAGQVRKYGETGLIQEFNTAGGGASKLALVKANSEGGGSVYQLLPQLFTYYNSVGSGTAGYPTADTANCPGLPCQYQLFDKKHALFVSAGGDNYTVKDAFYDKWQSAGAIAAMGPASSPEQEITAASGIQATRQKFTYGALYNMTSGVLTGRFLAVKDPIYTLYLNRGGDTGSLGLPTSEETVTGNGRKRQSFEGGSIEYDPSGGGPILRPQVSRVALRPGDSPVTLSIGETRNLQAAVFDSDGNELADRGVAFSTSNSRVIAVQQNGQTAALRAAGAGQATIVATSEGKASAPVTFTVTSVCCGIGEGAPSAAIRQAFSDAVMRNRLTVRTPAASRAYRSGAGYIQMLTGTDAAATRYLVAVPDAAGQGYVVSGALLTRYEALGGPLRPPGFPASDVTQGGRQMFDGGALAGASPRLVTGFVLQKWAALGFETGEAGWPAEEAVPVVTLTGAEGQSQAFAKGMIAGAGRGYFVGGLALGAYQSSGGPSGVLGLPVSDEFSGPAGRRQNFEGGAIEYLPGSTGAQVIESERKPSVTATPPAVIAGGRIRLVVAGFAPNSRIRVTLTAQPDFFVRTQTGAYVWDQLIPASAAPETVEVRAFDAANPSATAQAAYQVRAASDLRAQLTKVSGDTQTGVPGATLPQPLKIALHDEQGTPVAGAPVRFAASPGSEVLSPEAVTDGKGEATANVKLGPAGSVTLITAEAARQVVTFSARTAASSLPNFPRQVQTKPGESLIAAASAVIRFYQDQGSLPSSSGESTPAALTQYLRAFCAAGRTGQVCDGFVSQNAVAPNLWRLGGFVSQNLAVAVEKPDLATVRGLVGQGYPMILLIGQDAVVATGVDPDGTLQIHDPNPGANRVRFAAGDVTGAVRLFPGSPAGRGFLVTAEGRDFSLVSEAGECGETLRLGSFRQRFCSSSSPVYQLGFAGSEAIRATITDLGPSTEQFKLASSGSASFRISVEGDRIAVGPAGLAVASVVNSATFTPEVAPGGLIAIFGSGLAASGQVSRVAVAGRPLPVVSATAFQINAVLPADLPPGSHRLNVEFATGNAGIQVDVLDSAPAVFPGAIVNSDGKLNSVSSPVSRGSVLSIYGTGFAPSAQLPVTAEIGGESVPVAYADSAPGLPGVTQINLQLPTGTAPGLRVPLILKQASRQTQPAYVAIQ